MRVTACVRRRDIGSGCGRNVYDILGRTGLAVSDDMVSARASGTYESQGQTNTAVPSRWHSDTASRVEEMDDEEAEVGVGVGVTWGAL